MCAPPPPFPPSPPLAHHLPLRSNKGGGQVKFSPVWESERRAELLRESVSGGEWWKRSRTTLYDSSLWSESGAAAGVDIVKDRTTVLPLLTWAGFPRPPPHPCPARYKAWGAWRPRLRGEGRGVQNPFISSDYSPTSHAETGFRCFSDVTFTLRTSIAFAQLCHFPSCLCNSSGPPGRTSQSKPSETQ